MTAKVGEKAKATELRRKGLSYSEIRKEVKVSKSTLSVWFRELVLDKNIKNILESKLVRAQKLGAEARYQQRVEKTKDIRNFAVSQVPEISKKEVFLMGVMLYWGEGSKSRRGNISQGVEFSNSDPNMCRFFLKWLEDCLNVKKEDIVPCIYIHESKKDMKEKALLYWSKQINFPQDSFGRICLTKTVYPRKTKRVSMENYYGQLRIRVKRSTDLNRKIAGWTEGICIKSGVALQNAI